MDCPSDSTCRADPGLHLDGYLDHTTSVFRPVNPWKMTLRQCLMARHSIDTIRTIDDVQPNVPMFSLARPENYNPLSEKGAGGDQITFGWRSTTITFLTDWLPRRILINLLFHIPSVFFSRIEKAFDEAGESLVDMKRRALDESSGIKQPDVRTFEHRLGLIHTKGPGILFADLVSVLHFTLFPTYLCVILWIEANSLERLDPVSEIFGRLSFFSSAMAVSSSANFYSLQLPRRRLAVWNFNVAMDTRGIHQPYFWNICVDLSMRAVWAIWGYIFFALFILLAYLKRCWHLPVYDKFTVDPLTGVVGFMIFIFTWLLGMVNIYFIWLNSKNYDVWNFPEDRRRWSCRTSSCVKLDGAGPAVV